MNIQDGGPAFPVADYDHMVFEPKTVAETKRDLSGMSLRDYFAAKAMESLTPVYWEDFESYESGAALIECLCETAYEMADAMIAARSA